MPNYVQIIACPDQPGIIKNICDFIGKYDGNIIELEQHIDEEESMFFLRCLWQSPEQLDPNAIELELKHKLAMPSIYSSTHVVSQHMNMAVLVSKMDHCLFEILMRHQNNEWPVNIPIVISNHPDLAEMCAKFNVPFRHIPINGDKQKQEQEIMQLIAKYKIDCIVLARYMQILSEDFVNAYPNAIINIHHSFLPAFIGAKPYHQAHKKGVKIVGATSHYVTAELDQGPIISQDIAKIDHTHSIANVVHLGKDIERKVLSEAIKAHIEHKIIVINNKTVVFR